MDNEKKKPNGCAVGCLTVVLVIVALFIILIIWTNVTGYKTSPENQAKTEIQIIEDHYNELMTDMANLNVTGYGDFINMMKDQAEDAQIAIDDLNEEYGDDSEIINLCKQAWSDIKAIAEAAQLGLVNNDSGAITMIKQLQEEYETTIQQIKNMQTD